MMSRARGRSIENAQIRWNWCNSRKGEGGQREPSAQNELELGKRNERRTRRLPRAKPGCFRLETQGYAQIDPMVITLNIDPYKKLMQ